MISIFLFLFKVPIFSSSPKNISYSFHQNNCLFSGSTFVLWLKYILSTSMIFVMKTWKRSTFGGHQANRRSGGHCSIGCREFLSKLYCCTQILSESRNNFKQPVWQVFLLIKSKTVQFAYFITELNNCIELKHRSKILFVRFLHPVSTT